MRHVVVSGSFDDLRSQHVRFLEEAARCGRVHLLLWSDDLARSLERRAPRFLEAERLYFLQAVRFVEKVTPVNRQPSPHVLPDAIEPPPDIWVVKDDDDHPRKRTFCLEAGIGYHVVRREALAGFAISGQETGQLPARKKVIVTGCFDWLHSGHVRFFEEASRFGDLYVAVGHDANVRLLKGEGHPMFGQDERRYMVQAIRYVTQALITTGSGWMDAAPEIERIKPDIYLVNEDGDKPEKRAFCEQRGLEYVVLKRQPKEGLPRRESTHLRGF